MHHKLAALFLLALLTFAATVAAQDEAAGKNWYKGNLHTHSLWSDGNDFPEMIVDWYASRDYHFLALSDHNILSIGTKWMNLRDVNRRGGALALGKYQKRFGDEWVELRGEGDQKEVRLKPLAEFRGKFEKPGEFLLIQSEEITDRFDRLPVHINATNIQVLIKPQGGKSVQDVMRRNLAEVEKQMRETGKTIIPHLNHPNFGWAVTAEDIAAVTEERFFEVFNAHPGVRQLGDAQHASVDRLWDIANTLRIAKMQAAPLYGLGTDDSHNYHQRGGPENAMRRSEPGRAWVMIRAAELKTDQLLDAMLAGDFYASSGVNLTKYHYDADKRTLSLEIKPMGDARFTTQFIGTLEGYDDSSEPVTDKDGRQLTRKYSDEVGRVLKEVKGLKATYKLTGKELYVRALVTSSHEHPNPSYREQKQQAWTQPVGWQKRVKASE